VPEPIRQRPMHRYANVQCKGVVVKHRKVVTDVRSKEGLPGKAIAAGATSVLGTARCQVLTDLAIDLVFGEPPLLLRGTRWAEFGSHRLTARAGDPRPGGVSGATTPRH